jgi:hypothetical protein
MNPEIEWDKTSIVIVVPKKEFYKPEEGDKYAMDTKLYINGQEFRDFSCLAIEIDGRSFPRLFINPVKKTQ